MSQRIVVVCDVHQSRDEDAPGRPYDLMLREPGGTFRMLTVDLCEVCAKPVLDVFADVVEVGREFDGELPRGGKPPTPCPVCGKQYANRGSLRSHVERVHGESVTSATGQSEGLACPHCERTFARSQGLAAHVRSMHPQEFADAKARSGD
jgi:uncharacterized C2H2 Zn-finger protein